MRWRPALARRLVALVLFVWWVSFVLGGAPTARANDAERIRQAVDAVLATQLPNGFFRYDWDFVSGEPTGKDNVVRQAGTLFVLGEYLVDTRDERLPPVIRAGLDRMQAQSLPTGRGSLQSLLEQLGIFSISSWRLGRWLDSLGLLYDPDGDGLVVAEDGTYPTAATGATALALLAELQYYRATDDDRYASVRQRWMRGLLSLHVPGRGVRSHPATLEQGPYVDGEVWLALSYYHEMFPDDDDVARALAALENYAIDLYGGQPDRFFYHWGAMASANRMATSEDYERVVEFAAAQAEWILGEVPADTTENTTSCSLIEGLASSMVVLSNGVDPPDRSELLSRLRARVALELERNRALQIRPDQDRVEVGGGGLLLAPSLAANAGNFLASRYRIYTRTDITQHCLSALLKVRRYAPDLAEG